IEERPEARVDETLPEADPGDRTRAGGAIELVAQAPPGAAVCVHQEPGHLRAGALERIQRAWWDDRRRAYRRPAFVCGHQAEPAPAYREQLIAAARNWISGN